MNKLYTTNNCGFCERAKALLDKSGIEYDTIKIEPSDTVTIETMLKETNGNRSMPQVFIDNKHVGGYTELFEMYKNGEL